MKQFGDDDLGLLIFSTSSLHSKCQIFDLKIAAICQHLKSLRASTSTYTFTFDGRRTDNASFDTTYIVVCQTIGDVRIFCQPLIHGDYQYTSMLPRLSDALSIRSYDSASAESTKSPTLSEMRSHYIQFSLSDQIPTRHRHILESSDEYCLACQKIKSMKLYTRSRRNDSAKLSQSVSYKSHTITCVYIHRHMYTHRYVDIHLQTQSLSLTHIPTHMYTHTHTNTHIMIHNCLLEVSVVIEMIRDCRRIMCLCYGE